MTQKINEQGQKYIEVLSEEFIRLKELELNEVNWMISEFKHTISNTKEYSDLLNKSAELYSHIEDLKAELL